MNTPRISMAFVVAMLAMGLSSAWAFVITDVATTVQNAVTAVLKHSMVDTARAHLGRLQRMAARLTHTDLVRYSTPGAPAWTPHDAGVAAFLRALNEGDSEGVQYTAVARTRQALTVALASLPPAEREVIDRAMATLDLADSVVIAGAHQAGLLRQSGRQEHELIAQLEADVLSASRVESTTAVLDKLSGATVIEAHQKQARAQLLTAFVEQLLVDSKRARDTEVAGLNMRLGQLGEHDDEGGGLLTGAEEDLRHWRQP